MRCPAAKRLLVFIGGKMLAEFWDFHVPTNLALIIVAAIILFSVLLSMLTAKKAPQEGAS